MKPHDQAHGGRTRRLKVILKENVDLEKQASNLRNLQPLHNLPTTSQLGILIGNFKPSELGDNSIKDGSNLCRMALRKYWVELAIADASVALI